MHFTQIHFKYALCNIPILEMYRRIKILKSLCELKFPYPLRSPVWCLALLIIMTMTITILITNNANYLINPNIRHDTATVVAPVELSSKFHESFHNIRLKPLIWKLFIILAFKHGESSLLGRLSLICKANSQLAVCLAL